MKSRVALYWVVLLLTTVSGVTASVQVSQVDEFAAMPILMNGRKMPMDSFARHLLYQFSGRTRVNDQSALGWMCDVLFDQASVRTTAVFLVNHPEVVQALGLDVSKRGRFSYEELSVGMHTLQELASGAFSIEEEQRSPVEKEFLRLLQNLTLFESLLWSFEFDVPRDEFTPSPEAAILLGLPEGKERFSYLDIFNAVPRIQDIIDPLKGKDRTLWTEAEKDVVLLSSGLFEWTEARRSDPFVVIPFSAHGEEHWFTPWEAILMKGEHRFLEGELALLSEIRSSVASGDTQAFRAAVGKFVESTGWRVKEDRQVRMAPLEVRYNRAGWFRWATLAYGFGFLFSVAAFLYSRRWPWVAGLLLLGIGLVPHTIGIVQRMLIMGRPPVTNLYATFLFVSWVVVLLGMLWEIFQRQRSGLVTAALGGFALLMISNRFGMESDSMGAMVAVLNSNFWLSTHVVCITIGYAGCMAAGLVGHLYLLQAIFRPADRERLRATQYALYGLLGFGLTFSFFGTMLGGIWADQSWGRFWGWDPKENGALLIVIWCAVLFHARMGRMIGDAGFAAGAALGMIVVMFAWLGVNLLGVGLHSYGFTSGLFTGLFSYTGAQLILAFGLGWLASRNNRGVRHGG